MGIIYMSNYEKYKKYKNKYLTLKKFQVGGKQNIFDLNEKHNFSNDLQNNLKELEDTYGKSFLIKYQNLEIPVKLDKIKLDTSNLITYELYYDIPKRELELKPFSIQFYDYEKMELNNNTYISDIQRIGDISGSKMVELVLKIQEVLKVNKTILSDGANIKCDNIEIGLSYFKLIEKGITFYMKFGFDFELTGNEWSEIRFKDKEELHHKINELIEKIREIEIDDIINDYNNTIDVLCNVIKDQDYENLEIEYMSGHLITPLDTYFKKNTKDLVPQLFSECKFFLDLLNLTEKKYLYELIIQLFNTPNLCFLYAQLMGYILGNKRYAIHYNGTNIIRDYAIPFQYLYTVQSMYLFSYTFKK